jgi:hypothetical protein
MHVKVKLNLVQSTWHPVDAACNVFDISEKGLKEASKELTLQLKGGLLISMQLKFFL